MASRVAALMQAEQALYAQTRARSGALYAQGKRSWLYGAPSHWMRRWIGGWPIYTDVPAERLQPGALFDLIDAVQDINALALQAGGNAYEILTSLEPRYWRQYLENKA